MTPCPICGGPRKRADTKTCGWECGRIFHANLLRGRGEGKTYTKRDGRHEHIVIAERKLGRALRAGEIVHHRDHNLKNNDPDNLEVLASQAEHVRLHHTKNRKCELSECERKHYAKGWCSMHYQRHYNGKEVAQPVSGGPK